jgi:type I restriction enzyme M protein
MHFTQKTKTMRRTDLEEFVQAFKAGARNKRVETERFQKFTYEEIISRDKTNLDIFWLKDDSIIDAADLPAPVIIAQEIADSLQSALDEIQAIIDGLSLNGDPGFDQSDETQTLDEDDEDDEDDEGEGEGKANA